MEFNKHAVNYYPYRSLDKNRQSSVTHMPVTVRRDRRVKQTDIEEIDERNRQGSK
jgi:hypothetical protein